MTHRGERLREIAQTIGSDHTVALFPHVGVDGDCIGAGLALKSALEKGNNHVHIISDSRMAARFTFLPGSDQFDVYDGNRKPTEFIQSLFGKTQIDFAVLEDCSSPERIGICKELLPCFDQLVIVDHHFSQQCDTPLCCIDPNACATGELIYDFIVEYEKILGVEIFDENIAINILSAIYFDTGGLRYTNTVPKAFCIAADLTARFPVNIRTISYNLFEKTALSKICIEAKAYSSIYFHADNKVAICLITKKMIDDCEANDDDMDGICTDIKNIEQVEVAFVLREKENNEIRGNIRSSELFDSSEFAGEFDGGGHKRASGFTITNMTIMDAYKLVTDKSTAKLLESGTDYK